MPATLSDQHQLDRFDMRIRLNPAEVHAAGQVAGFPFQHVPAGGHRPIHGDVHRSSEPVADADADAAGRGKTVGNPR